MSTAALKRMPGSATEADLLALPEQGRGYELIDGELTEKQSGFRHGRAQFNRRRTRMRSCTFGRTGWLRAPEGG